MYCTHVTKSLFLFVSEFVNKSINGKRLLSSPLQQFYLTIITPERSFKLYKQRIGQRLVIHCFLFFAIFKHYKTQKKTF